MIPIQLCKAGELRRQITVNQWMNGNLVLSLAQVKTL